MIGVDPSDSGEGDAAGIVAASLTPEGVVVVHRDISEPMTPEAWATAAIELAIDTGASRDRRRDVHCPRGLFVGAEHGVAPLPVAAPCAGVDWPPKGDTHGRGRGDAMARSAKLIQGLETGDCAAGRLTAEPGDARRCSGRPGTHQPDCLAALTVAFDVLTHGAGGVHREPFRHRASAAYRPVTRGAHTRRDGDLPTPTPLLAGS